MRIMLLPEGRGVVEVEVVEVGEGRGVVVDVLVVVVCCCKYRLSVTCKNSTQTIIIRNSPRPIDEPF